MPNAVVMTGYGPPEVLKWTQVPLPEPGKGQVRIKVKASLGGQQPAGHLAVQSERARQLRLQVPGRGELLECLPGAPRRAPR